MNDEIASPGTGPSHTGGSPGLSRSVDRPDPGRGPRILDRAAALERFDGDESLLHEVAAMFLQTLPGHLASLHAALDRDDPATAERTAHSIKGGAATLGAEAASEAARTVESLAREKRLGDARDGCAALRAELDQVVRALAGWPPAAIRRAA